MSRMTADGPAPLTGRGALSNPPGRFERRQVEAVTDGWYTEEASDSIATSVEPDRARGIITTNDSPDLPFDYSINPYRGCEHGCIYCVSGDTPILMADGTWRAMAALEVGDAILGTARDGRHRRYIKTRVLAHWTVVKPAFRIVLGDATELVAGADHRFLTERGWKFVTGTAPGSGRRPHLRTGNKLMGTGAFASGPVKDLNYGRGYLCGLTRGDSFLGSYAPVRASGQRVHTQLRLAPGDSEALLRAESCLHQCRIETHQLAFAAASGSARAGDALGLQARFDAGRISGLMGGPGTASPSWSAGFLAGIFDAAGSYSDGVLRISSTDEALSGRIGECLRSLNMEYRIERSGPRDRRPIEVIRLLGGLREHLRFFHSVDPAITRKRDISNQAVKSGAQLGVVAIEKLGHAMRLYDITTGTGDFIANGIVSHNCYARPSHAYLGLSAGIDFETRLFYKADAGRVLEGELARPSYVCKPITIGANTDPYQPVERRLKVTRSILEVLARTRHPMSIITKSALILRDLDLLTDLARDALVSVAISITTLNADTKRALEPRTASPQARLRVLRELNAAGVPAGVMVAPVIPVITDHEMEAILAAAAEAGARWAAYVLVRLPYEVKDLFREWLTEHFPDRAAHVMALIRDMRGGRDNDPRFGSRMRGSGPVAELLRSRFKLACGRLALNAGSREQPKPTQLFRPPGRAEQLTLGF
jgi:DNA repair photolyase